MCSLAAATARMKGSVTHPRSQRNNDTTTIIVCSHRREAACTRYLIRLLGERQQDNALDLGEEVGAVVEWSPRSRTSFQQLEGGFQAETSSLTAITRTNSCSCCRQRTACLRSKELGCQKNDRSPSNRVSLEATEVAVVATLLNSVRQRLQGD